MALEPMKRIVILAHQSRQQRVLRTLQELGAVHVEAQELGDSLSKSNLSEDQSGLIRNYSYRVSEIDFLLDFLKEHQEEKTGFVKSLVKDKYEMTFREFSSIEDRLDLETIYQECSELEREIITARDQISRLAEEKKGLEEWIRLDIPLDQVRGGDTFDVIPLKMAAATLDELLSRLDTDVPESSLEIVDREGNWAECLLICHRELKESALGVVSGYKNEIVTFPESDMVPASLIEWVDDQSGSMQEKKENLVKRVAGYQQHRRDLIIAKDFYLNCISRLESSELFGVTDSTFQASGWIPESAVGKTCQKLQLISKEVVVEVMEPEEGESPPVQLKNNKLIRPFEVLTRLYGVPHNKEYDPTWLIAVSFIVFFGFCIGDVGYGLSLIIVFSLLRKFLPLGKTVKDLFVVLASGSAFAMVMGVLTGSYFGIDPDSLPAFLKSLAIFDPLYEPIPIMLVCIVIGLLHMLSGVIVEFRDNWKQGNKAAALIEQGLIIYLFVGSTIAAVLMVIGVVDLDVVFIVAGSALAGMAVLFGYNSKTIPGKIFGGLYETYNTIIGWLGDAVSYLRLFALGLATFAVGWVFNIVGGMVKGVGFGIGIVLMIVILLVGHTFNVAINLLGAFVHPLRLEFVEFFSKFYEDGGEPFKPLRVESKQVVIKE